MLIDLILSKLPTKNQFNQVFNKFSLDNFYVIQDNDWGVLSDKNTDNSMIINITNTKDKKWRYFISIYINKKIENQKLLALLIQNTNPNHPPHLANSKLSEFSIMVWHLE